MDEKTVFNIIERYEALNRSAIHKGHQPTDYHELTRDYSQLVGAWQWFKEGKATPKQQRICYYIHKYLINRKPYPTQPQYVRNMRIKTLIEKFDITETAAIEHVADMDGIKFDSCQREFRKWKNQTTDEVKSEETKRFLASYKNPFV